jgi:methylmalonyl-CoA/ethylmalonyl-CoA epimerase
MRLDHVRSPQPESPRAFLPVGESEVELVQPTSPDTAPPNSWPSAARHPPLVPGGAGHRGHARALKAAGVRLINETPQELEGRRIAFVHPKSTGGVLIEFYELIR